MESSRWEAQSTPLTGKAQQPPRAGLCGASGSNSEGGELLPRGASPAWDTSLCPRKNFRRGERACSVDYTAASSRPLPPGSSTGRGCSLPAVPARGWHWGTGVTLVCAWHGHSRPRGAFLSNAETDIANRQRNQWRTASCRKEQLTLPGEITDYIFPFTTGLTFLFLLIRNVTSYCWSLSSPATYRLKSSTGKYQILPFQQSLGGFLLVLAAERAFSAVRLLWQ